MKSSSVNLRDCVTKLLSDREILSKLPEVIGVEYLKRYFERRYLGLLLTNWTELSESEKVFRSFACAADGKCSSEYFLGSSPGCPLVPLQMRLDTLSDEQKIEHVLKIPPHIMLCKIFSSYWQSLDIWDALNLTSNLEFLRKTPKENLEFMYHNGGKFPCHSHELYGRVIFPRYEDLIIGLIVAVIAGILGGIATTEYQRWRDKKSRRLDELKQALALLLLESELRHKIEVLHEIEYNLDIIEFEKAQEKALKLIDSLRATRGKTIPKQLTALKGEQDRLAEDIFWRILEMFGEHDDLDGGS